MFWVGSLGNNRQTVKSINFIKLKKINISINSLGKIKIHFQYHSHFIQGKSNVTSEYYPCYKYYHIN